MRVLSVFVDFRKCVESGTAWLTGKKVAVGVFCYLFVLFHRLQVLCDCFGNFVMSGSSFL